MNNVQRAEMHHFKFSVGSYKAVCMSRQHTWANRMEWQKCCGQLLCKWCLYCPDVDLLCGQTAFRAMAIIVCLGPAFLSNVPTVLRRQPSGRPSAAS